MLTFNLRLPKALHQAIRLAAERHGISMNAWMLHQLREAVYRVQPERCAPLADSATGVQSAPVDADLHTEASANAD